LLAVTKAGGEDERKAILSPSLTYTGCARNPFHTSAWRQDPSSCRNGRTLSILGSHNLLEVWVFFQLLRNRK